MIEQIQQTLIKNCQIDPDRPILVGVSGGPDSLFLLDILNRLGLKLVVGHLDHMLRPESSAEAASVRVLTQAAGLKTIIESKDVRVFAGEHHLSIETAARQVRYEFLFHQAALFQAQAVAVAHTADDQVETLLLHLLRGAGLDGLTGMPYHSLPNAWSRSIPLIRPILGIWRSAILQYLSEHNISPHWDSTNLDPAYLRNRVRHELIPYLENYNPRIRQSLWRTAEILQQEDLEIQTQAQKAWEVCVTQHGTGSLALDKEMTARQPIAIRRRVVRMALSELRPGLPDIEFAHIEKIIQFLDQPTRSASSEITAGVRIFQERNLVWLATGEADSKFDLWPQIARGKILQIQVPGEMQISPGWTLKASLIPGNSQNLSLAVANKDPFQAWLNFDKVTFPINLRCRQPGDRFQPLGLVNGTIKISDLYINNKLPKRARAGWPLVVDSQAILWAPGIQISERLRIDPGCTRILHLEIQRT